MKPFVATATAIALLLGAPAYAASDSADGAMAPAVTSPQARTPSASSAYLATWSSRTTASCWQASVVAKAQTFTASQAGRSQRSRTSNMVSRWPKLVKWEPFGTKPTLPLMFRTPPIGCAPRLMTARPGAAWAGKCAIRRKLLISTHTSIQSRPVKLSEPGQYLMTDTIKAGHKGLPFVLRMQSPLISGLSP